MSHSQPDNSRRRLRNLVIPRQSCGDTSAESAPTSWSPSPYRITSPLPDSGMVGELYTSDHCNEILDWTELELLSHYLTHTSRIIPYDTEDLYALRVGIPNLAFHSKPLMSSILALAAVCKSHDLVKQPQPARDKIMDLLALAERHHRASLLQVQIDLPNANHYDYVLANAPLMVLYASANHCVRIRLAATQTKDETLPREFAPAQSQWISLIRAAHLAYAGLLNDQSEISYIGRDIELSLTSTGVCSNSEAECINETISPEGGPTERTKNLLFPILAASSGPALEALRARAWEIRKIEGNTASLAQSSNSFGTPHLPSGCSVDLQACFSSLDILSCIVAEVFASKDSLPHITSCCSNSQSKFDPPSLGQLSTVSSWLRSYVARVTSSTLAPRPLRRVIMAFINRVPAEFLSLVQTTLDSIGVQTGNDHQGSWESSDFDLQNVSAAHKLAIDIFAHWAVLLMLLDGVWWIGDIGTWELGRVVSFVRAQGWLNSLTGAGEHWWPESMYNVGRELRNLVNTT